MPAASHASQQPLFRGGGGPPAPDNILTLDNGDLLTEDDGDLLENA